MSAKPGEVIKDVGTSAGVAALNTLTGALGGSTPTTPAATTTTIVQQSTTPTWLPWAIGGAVVLGLGGMVVAVSGGRK